MHNALYESWFFIFLGTQKCYWPSPLWPCSHAGDQLWFLPSGLALSRTSDPLLAARALSCLHLIQSYSLSPSASLLLSEFSLPLPFLLSSSVPAPPLRVDRPLPFAEAPELLFHWLRIQLRSVSSLLRSRPPELWKLGSLLSYQALTVCACLIDALVIRESRSDTCDVQQWQTFVRYSPLVLESLPTRNTCWPSLIPNTEIPKSSQCEMFWGQKCQISGIHAGGGKSW